MKHQASGLLTSLESILASSLALRIRFTIHRSASSGVMFSLSANMLQMGWKSRAEQSRARGTERKRGKESRGNVKTAINHKPFQVKSILFMPTLINRSIKAEELCLLSHLHYINITKCTNKGYSDHSDMREQNRKVSKPE